MAAEMIELLHHQWEFYGYDFTGLDLHGEALRINVYNGSWSQKVHEYKGKVTTR